MDSHQRPQSPQPSLFTNLHTTFLQPCRLEPTVKETTTALLEEPTRPRVVRITVSRSYLFFVCGEEFLQNGLLTRFSHVLSFLQTPTRTDPTITPTTTEAPTTTVDRDTLATRAASNSADGGDNRSCVRRYQVIGTVVDGFLSKANRWNSRTRL